MKRRLTLFFVIGLMALGMIAQDREHVLRLGDFMKPKGLTLPAFTAGQYLTNDGTNLSWGAISFAGYLRADGTVPLTADWNVGAFDLTCVDMNATNFKLSGTGTLTSTAGEVSLTTSIVNETTAEAAFTLAYTVDKTAANNDTGLKIVQTDTASGGTSYLQEWYTGSTRAAYLDRLGNFWLNDTTGTLITSYVMTTANNTSLTLGYARNYTAANNFGIHMLSNESFTQSSGTNNIGVKITPTVNQTGTASMFDLVVNRTQTATGSGTQRLFSAQIGSAEKFGIDNTGQQYNAGVNNQQTNFRMASAIVTTTAAATATATNLIPAGSMVIGVTCRNTSAITGDAGFTGFSIGDGSDVDRWGANVNPAINETTDLTDITIASPVYYTATTSVVLTQVGGSTFVADGTVAVTVHYVQLVAADT